MVIETRLLTTEGMETDEDKKSILVMIIFDSAYIAFRVVQIAQEMLAKLHMGRGRHDARGDWKRE